MNSRPGFRRIVLWDKENTKSNVLPISLRSEVILKIDDLEDIKTYRGQILPANVNFSSEVEILNSAPGGWSVLDFLLLAAKANGVCAEFLGERTGVSTHEGVYKFIYPNYIGVDWEYGFEAKKRFAKVTLGRSFGRITAKAIVADSVTADYTHFGVSPYDYEPGYNGTTQFFLNEFFSFTYGTARTVLFDRGDIVDMKVIMKTESEKSAYDVPFCSWITIDLSITLNKASKTDINDLLAITEMCPQINFRVKYNDADNYEEHQFDAGVLSFKKGFNLADKSRTATLTFSGKVNPYSIAASVANDNITYRHSL
jgi:hypothetical protein